MKQKIFALFLCLAMIANILSLSIYADGRDISDFEIEIETNGELSLEALAGRVLPESDRPEVVSLSSVAANGHVNRLRTQETELSDVIFQNTDGTKTLYRFSYPVKYVDENGNTLDKSNSVSAITVGDTRYGTYAYVNPNNDINTYFPQTLNSAQGISLEWDDLKIEMSPISAAIGEETAAVQTTNAVLSAQAATAQKLSYNADGESKDAVSFNGVFGAATTVRYTPTFDGVKEDIILNSYNGTKVNTNVVGSTKKEKYTYRGQIANDVFFVGTATDKRLYLALHTNGGEATYSVAFYNSVGGEKTRGLADALTNAVYPIIPLGTYHTPIAGLYGYNINTNPMVEYDPWVGNLGEIKINEGTYSYYDEYGNLCHSTGYNTPAVLLEIAFHDKPEQTEFLIQSYNEKYIAATIAKSLVEYYNLQPKL